MTAFLYEFNHTWADPECGDLYYAEYYGVTHCAEIPFVFGMPTFVFGKPVHPEKCHMSAKEALFADTVGRFWSSLAADSPQARDFVWPAYQNTTDMALVLQPGGFSMAHGWRHEACSVLKGYSPWRL